ncbi:MAG: acetyl-CoA acetyltransferase [Acidimicrobiales bacterium]
MSDLDQLDPRTPVLVGVGQASERINEPTYRRMSAVDLAAEAAREALADTGCETAAIARAVDTVAGVRQFEISAPWARARLGKSNNYPRSVANRLSSKPSRAILEVAGGQSPQRLITELASVIAAGKSEVALVFGSEATSTSRLLAGEDDRPDFSESVDGDLEDRGYGLDGLSASALTMHGLSKMTSQYALFDNARRARLGQSREAYALSMGELLAPFSRIAARNPHAAAPTERNAHELATPTERNRRISDPYTRYLVARDQVNQGAAVLLMSLAAARQYGVPRDKRVFLHGHADLHDRDLLDRTDLSASAMSVMAVRHALDIARVTTADLTTIDLYSCFPIAVFNICDGLNIPINDERGLTVTGGLPFFGGAGSNYSMHAVAETVNKLRSTPGAFGLVGANGGTLSKYSAGVYSTKPTAWRPNHSAQLQAMIDGWPVVDHVERADGWATVETYTVTYRGTERQGIVIGRLESDGKRFVALTTQGDEKTMAILEDEMPIGTRVFVRNFETGNRVAVSERHLISP